MSFTPTKYELKLTVDFNENTFIGNVKIHVEVTDPVKEFDLKMSKDLEIERIAFWQAEFITRGNPQMDGKVIFDIEKKDDSIHVPLYDEITSESIKEEGYIEVDYKGKVGEKGANKGLFLINSSDYETNLENGNAIHLFPILEDVAAPLTLSVITPYRAGVETTLKAGEHASIPEKELISNNFNSGDEKVKISELYFQINAPTPLILD
ncbi:hypothetical protein GCK72_020262 [Caenorhabditis remanei]|uniref:Aminopeptidase N-like N-terminal domain-containing protein n=1 Tax=Caenorhabditis remanei TaxID=31234 RepID=A0A6A5GGE2_CAERE|nr:hypothetical protein GCK72_020262 [Caenorhabditis remanei]KAF1753705.1 hypothetical protein GCK72_020262 [Caenorhabditis remanei]